MKILTPFLSKRTNVLMIAGATVGGVLLGILLLSTNISFFSTAHTTTSLGQKLQAATDSKDVSESLQDVDFSRNLIYVHSDDEDSYAPGSIYLSHHDGSDKKLLLTVPSYGTFVGANIEHGTFFGKGVFAVPPHYDQDDTEPSTFWLVEANTDTRKVLSFPPGQRAQFPLISPDGTGLVYARGPALQELWFSRIDGTGAVSVIDDTGKYLRPEDAEFFSSLVPMVWSEDERFVYLVPFSDQSDAAPVGVYVLDLQVQSIEFVDTLPPVPLRASDFSPDKSSVAYTTANWALREAGDHYFEPSAPFSITLTHRVTGTTETLLQSMTHEYQDILWSHDGKKILYTLRARGEDRDEGIFVYDREQKKSTKLVAGLGEGYLTPLAWLSEDRFVYQEETFVFKQGIRQKASNRLITRDVSAEGDTNIQTFLVNRPMRFLGVL